MPYFRPDCVKNAHNGTTIAVLFALSEQKYNKKSVYCSELPTLAKSSLLSTAREVAEIEVSTKLDYRLHRAYNNSSALSPHRTQNPLSKTHTLLCPAISKTKKKSFCPLSDADFFCKEKGCLNSWVYG